MSSGNIEVVNIFKNNSPPYVDLTAGGFAFTFWFEGKRLRYQKKMESGIQNAFSASLPKGLLPIVRRKAAAILKSL
ncbi:MAG: hypothetical protein U9P50_01620 [Patescibacteria group bacterium]|nr:hypothetical protein [Patescibacteria group bacterium]